MLSPGVLPITEEEASPFSHRTGRTNCTRINRPPRSSTTAVTVGQVLSRRKRSTRGTPPGNSRPTDSETSLTTVW